jgi:exopolysaccharide production protein ExoQ
MRIPALVACIIFIVYLLNRDVRRRKTLSWAVWLPTIYLWILGSRPLSLWLVGRAKMGSGLANNAEGSPIDQIFFFSLIVGSLIVATMRRVKWSEFFASNLPLLLFYLYFAISIFWSEDPMGSSKRLFKDFGMLFVIALILSEKDPLEAIGAIYVRCACVLFPLSALCIKWFPDIGRIFSRDGEPQYIGLTTQKNTLGEIVLVFSLFMIWDYLENRPRKWRWGQLPWDRLVLLLIGFWLLRMCQSKTAMLCLLLATALMVRSGWFASKTFSRAVLVVALSLPYILFFAQRFEWVLAPIVQAVGRNMTFTGRTDIWQHIDSTTVNPLIGYGFYNFWGGTGGRNINEVMHMTIPNAHDGYVDLYLDGGIIGLVLLFFLLVTYGNRLIKKLQNSRFQRLRFAVLIAAIIYNCSESNWARLSVIWFTTVLALAYFPSIKTASRRLPSPQLEFRGADTQPQNLHAVQGN